MKLTVRRGDGGALEGDEKNKPRLCPALMFLKSRRRRPMKGTNGGNENANYKPR
jgi:hypothetical protein